MIFGSRRLTSFWTQVSDRPMHARVAREPGPGPPVVLVHGLVVSSRTLLPTAHHLAPDYAVYAPDLPGFGQSPGPPDALDTDGLADALAAWLDAMELPRAAFVGNSFGCQIIVALALRHPGRVARAVLQGPSGDPEASPLREMLRLGLDGLREPLTLPLVYLRDLYDAGIRRSWQTFNYLLHDDFAASLYQMAAPTLVVRGTRDPLVPDRWAEEVARRLPCGRLLEVPDGTHAINYARPRDLARIVRTFVDPEDLHLKAAL